MAEETLLLRVRAEALKANLGRLRTNLIAIPSRLVVLGELDRSLEKISDVIADTRKTMIDIDNKATAMKVAAELAGSVDNVNEKLQLVRTRLNEARTAISKLQKNCFHVTETPVAEKLKDDLEKSTNPLVVEIDNIVTGSRSAAPDCPDLWGRLSKMATSELPILSDYVELMGGVALRDTGFDEGISELADELLRAYIATGGKANFVAIPMREQALLKTFAQIIRVTFPDWTLWSLPSTALEFWNAVASKTIRDPLDAQIRTLGPAVAATIQPADYDCLGDGYAVFTMGPAYAYCAVALIFDPTVEEHHRRVRAVLEMLECMDRKEGPLGGPYEATRSQLLEAWNAARKQLGHDELAMVDGDGIALLMQTFADVLSRLTSPGFVVDVWNEIQPWVPLLLDGEVSKIEIPKGAELRHVFNAAWIARTHRDRNPNVDLTSAVQKLRDLVREKGK